MAYDEVKKGENTQLFSKVVNKIDGMLGHAFGPDPDWTQAVHRKADVGKDELENELNAYRVLYSLPGFIQIHSTILSNYHVLYYIAFYDF